jgi:valyl-tRNA synthetase
VVADDYVDMTFGSGAVKMTPAHDPNDFEVGMRHGLEQIRVMNDDGTMNALAGKYEGMDRYECRKAILKDLEELGLVEDIKEHVHNVGGCYRCGTTVETITSEQWFVDMKPLAAPAIDVVKKGETNFIPERFSKIYFNWLENIKDWCISRQLWWGHRIPAYYCENCGEMMVAEETPLKCTKCGYSEIVQDEDVLDTWFSSGLWPFSTLGWPEETKDLKKFYPNNVLVTGYDIIFFWVARMIFSGIEQMGETPYKDVYIHGLVRDEKGRKMSKSLGNGVDPLEVIHNYSADALRFTIITGNSAGNDIRWIESNLEASRNFANKIWNASRFVMMYLDDEVMNNIDVAKENLSVTDLWIRSRANQVISEVTKNMEKYEFGLAADKVYDFAWNEYCDWYIEFVKPRLYGEDKNSQIAAVYTLVTVLKDILKCLHPFMPFITEEIFSYLPGNKTDIMVSKWPEYNEKYINISAEKEVRVIMEGIKAIRNIRAEMNVVPTKKVAINFIPDNNDIAEIILNAKQYFEKMTAVTGIIILEKETQIENSISRIINGGEIIISLDDLVDKEKEVQRLQTEKVKLEKEIDRVVKKLNNPGFVNKAPEKVVRAEKEKQTQYTDMLDKVLKRLEYYQQ